MISTLKHGSANVLVYSNGTVKDDLIINAEVNCEVNLFNYPFAYDVCPVAVQAWDTDSKLSNSLIYYICDHFWDVFYNVSFSRTFLAICISWNVKFMHYHLNGIVIILTVR